MLSRGVPLLLAIAGVCNALVPHRIAAARSNALSAFKSNFPPVEGEESTTDKPTAAAKTEPDAASDASRAALEASFAKAEAEPVAEPAAGAALLDALTGKTKGADLGPLIDAC